MILCDACDAPASRLLLTGPPEGRRFGCDPCADNAREPLIFKPGRRENDALRMRSLREVETAIRRQNVERGLLSKRRFFQLEGVRYDGPTRPRARR